MTTFPKKSGFQEVRNCKYDKCGIEFTAKRRNQFYHAPKCKQADWHKNNFAKPRPDIDPEVWLRAKREFNFEYTQSQVLRLLKEFREA